MTKLFVAFVAALVLALAGCGGGGGDGVLEVPVAPAPAPLPVVVPDVTFTQIATTEVVTPGEAFRPVLIAVTCPTMVGTQSCMKTLLLGEIGFTSDLPLMDVKIFHDGNAVEGYFTQVGSKYRFTPTGYNLVWQPGVIEVKAVLSPTAQDGAKTTMVVQAANASIDTTLNIEPGETAVVVKVLSYNAPAVITPLSEGNGFTYFCPPSVSSGCRLEGFNTSVNGAAASSEVRLSVGDLVWNQIWTDVNGYLLLTSSVGNIVHPGVTVTVLIFSKPGLYGVASVWFYDFKSWSGDKIIAPTVPTNCTSVSSQYCKG